MNYFLGLLLFSCFLCQGSSVSQNPLLPEGPTLIVHYLPVIEFAVEKSLAWPKKTQETMKEHKNNYCFFGNQLLSLQTEDRRLSNVLIIGTKNKQKALMVIRSYNAYRFKMKENSAFVVCEI